MKTELNNTEVTVPIEVPTLEEKEDNLIENHGAVDFSKFREAKPENSIDFSQPKDDDKNHPKVPLKFNRFQISENRVEFTVNNWMEDDTRPTIQLIDKKGASLWMYTDGEFAFRRKPNSKVQFKITKSKLKTVLNKLLKKVVIIDDNEEDIGAIKSFDLLMVSDDVFNPFIKQEFFEKNDEVFRNTFRTTVFMDLDKNLEYKKPLATLALLLHLTNGKKDRLEWVINWLAYFFQGLKKSPVAWVAKGNQGGGKGIFYEEVLCKLFGDKQCIQVNDKTMKGNFLGGIVANRLVMNLDEISTGMKSNKEFKNQLKALISNRSGTFEKKNITTDDVTDLFAMIFITTNEPQALEVEHKDRRLTIYTTGCNLSEVDFLGYGSYDKLINAIQREVEDFALYLKNYDVDVKLATTAQDTPEKEALVGVTSDRFQTFYVALMKKDIAYFEDLKYMNSVLYNNLVDSFKKNELSKKQLRFYFNVLEEETISSKKLLLKLRTINSFIFNDSLNSKGDGVGDGVGGHFYYIDNEYNPYYQENIVIDSAAVSSHVSAPVPKLPENNLDFIKRQQA